jgi:hypothetical protein
VRASNGSCIDIALKSFDELCSNINQAVGVAQTIMMCVAVSHGFGKSPALSSNAKARLAEKACRDVFRLEYTITLLTIVKYMYAVAVISLCANAISKAAMLFFHLRITPRRAQRMTCYVLAGICGLWMAVVMALTGTRCENKQPWALYGRTCHTFVSRRVYETQSHVADV